MNRTVRVACPFASLERLAISLVLVLGPVVGACGDNGSTGDAGDAQTIDSTTSNDGEPADVIEQDTAIGPDAELDGGADVITDVVQDAGWDSAFGGTPTAITAGGYHSCAIVASGRAGCWGDNQSEQLGDTTDASSPMPVAVWGLSSGVTSLWAGQVHTCAVVNGGATCWGDNSIGQLGDGTTNGSSIPVAVSGLSSGVSSIAGGYFHSCAIVSGGGLKCWGFNSSGELGDGSNADSHVPVAVSGLSSGVTAVTTGAYHTCAIVNGAALCWGQNTYGQLGNNSTTDSNVPAPVTGLSSGVTAISAGNTHTCAIVSGAAKCWGSGSHGELGDGANSTYVSVPVAVSGLSSGVTAIAAGGAYTCAIVSGGAQCWGSGAEGQLGNGQNIDEFFPVNVASLSSGVSAISAGGAHACALVGDGGAECWGSNQLGELGNGQQDGGSNVPVAVLGL